MTPTRKPPGPRLWFAFSPTGCGLEFFATADEARAEAEGYLDSERDEAGEGWSEETTQIVWGRIHGEIEETMRRPRNENDVGIDTRCETVVDYALVDRPDNARAELAALRERVKTLEQHLRATTGPLAEDVAETLDDRSIDKSKWYRAVKRARTALQEPQP
jgi:hypothetical protein